MKIAIIQTDIVWAEVDTNLLHMSNIIKSLPDDTILVIFPEMCTTGFHPEPHLVANLSESYTTDALQSLVKESGISIMATIACQEGDLFYNRCVLVEKDRIQRYDKIHLFSLGREKEAFCGGDKISNFSFAGISIRPLICYDLRFPYLSFTTTPYDLLIYCASWPAPRIHHWERLLEARAIENQSFVIGVNRTGIDGLGLQYPGHSMALGFDGSVLLEPTNQLINFVDLDFELQKNYRAKLPFFQDRQAQYMP